MKIKPSSKFLISTPADTLWGLCVTTTGYQSIGAGESYPPEVHPSRYIFAPDHKRTLDEYQFIYITKGSGWFFSKSFREKTIVKEGDMLLLFPGEWHAYCPDENTGWDEMWIGCEGEILQLWHERGIISPQNPILHPGMHTRLLNLYERAGEYAGAMKPDYQKALGATAADILGIALYFDKSNIFSDNDASTLMSDAKEMIFADASKISPEEIAQKLGIGYSRFRKLFKSYFGIPPGQYILQIKLANAKELLTNTRLQIQEVAWNTGFENPDNFIASFKRVTGVSPGSYRKKTRGE